MRTVHQILLLGAAMLWAAGHARAALPDHAAGVHGARGATGIGIVAKN